MQSNLVQISNIFNLMVQADSRLNFYHFGWRSDINRNIDNNFDQGTQTGRLYPSVQFHVPENTSISNSDLDYLGSKEEIQITLYFDNLQDFNNDSSQKTDTLIEQWTNLKQIAEDFVRNFNIVFCEKYGMGSINSEIKYISRSNLHNDKLITLEVSFDLLHTTPCTVSENIIDINLLPTCIKEYDLENYLKDTPFNSLSLSFDGVNEYLEATDYVPYDFNWNDPFTVSGWIYAASIQNANLVTHAQVFGPFGENTGWAVAILADGTIRVDMQGAGLMTNFMSIRAGTSYPVNQWFHYCVTFNGTGTGAGTNVYVDGVLQSKLIVSDTLAGASIKNIAPLRFCTNNALTVLFEGNYNKFRIWNKVLSQSEINQEVAGICVDDGCPVSIVAPENNVLDVNFDEATFNGSEFFAIDMSGTILGINSFNMEEEDLISDSPCTI